MTQDTFGEHYLADDFGLTQITAGYGETDTSPTENTQDNSS